MNINNFAVSEISNKYNVSTFLIASYLFLIPFGRLSAVPMAVMALLGIRLILQGKVVFKKPEFLYFSLVFLCFWIPIILSLFDAVNVEKTAKISAVYFHYYLAGLFIIHSLMSDICRHRKIASIFTYILVFWIADALFQAVSGFNLLGYPLKPSALNGIFGERNPKFGIYLAALSPFVFFYARKHWNVFLQLLIVCCASSVIFLSGRRGAWIMLLVVMVGFSLWVIYLERKAFIRWMLTAVFLISCCFMTMYYVSSPFAARVDKTMLVFDGNLQNIDAALSHRLPIWNVAVSMIKAHPVNGVGARGFRYAYAEFADENDRYVSDDSIGAFQAHQLILDIGSNTGFIGIAGFLFACYIVVKRWMKANLYVKEASFPYALALLAVFFPINTHLATYSSQWSSFFFWLLALYFSVRSADSDPVKTRPSSVPKKSVSEI